MQKFENQTDSFRSGRKIVRVGATGFLVTIILSQLMTQVAIIVFQNSESLLRLINVAVQLIGFIFPALFASMAALGLFVSKLGVTVPVREDSETQVFRNSAYVATALVALGILSIFGVMSVSFATLDNQLLDIVINLISVVSIYFGLPLAGVLMGTAMSFRTLHRTTEV